MKEGKATTAWVTVEKPEKLRTSRNAKVIREVLKKEHPADWRIILERAIERIQTAVANFKKEKEVTEKEEEKIEVPEEIRKKAEELLHNPRILHVVLKDINRFVVGEEKEILLCFLLSLSCKSKKDYAFFIVSGDSSAGKSWLVQHVLRYTPKEWWRKVGRLSRTALDYLQDQDFYLLWIQERRGGREASESIRLSSVEDGGTEIWVTARNPETGEFETRVYHVPGRSIITTTVDTDIDSQDLTRSWIISVDESKEQTERILEYQASEAQNPFELRKALGKEEGDQSIVIQEALRCLEWDFTVIIPFADEIKNIVPSDQVRVRRDLKKFYRLIRVITLLHQKMRPQFTVNGEKFLVSSPEDLYIACVVAGESFRQTVMGLDRREKEVIQVLKEEDGWLTRRQIAQRCRKSMSWAYERLTSLINKGVVDVDESERPYRYSLRENNGEKHSSTFFDRLSFSVLEKKFKSFLERMCVTSTPEEQYNFIFTGENPSKTNALQYTFKYVNPITGEIINSPPTVNVTHVQSGQDISLDEGKNKEKQSKNENKQKTLTKKEEKKPEKKDILHALKDAPDQMMKREDLIKSLAEKFDETAINKLIAHMIIDGDLYEPRPPYIKPTSEIDVRPFTVSQVASISRLKLADIGPCPWCNRNPCRLTYAVKTFDKKIFHVCGDCAEKIMKEKKKCDEV